MCPVPRDRPGEALRGPGVSPLSHPRSGQCGRWYRVPAAGPRPGVRSPGVRGSGRAKGVRGRAARGLRSRTEPVQCDRGGPGLLGRAERLAGEGLEVLGEVPGRGDLAEGLAPEFVRAAE